MPTLKRIRAGVKAKISGKLFERLLKSFALKQKYAVIHLPPLGAECIGPGKFKTTKMPFDFIFSKNGKSLFIDAKSTDLSSFSYSMINPTQAFYLINQYQAGCVAGYIVYFSKLNQFIFFDAKKLYEVKAKESLKPMDGLCLGEFEINLDLLI